MIKGWITALSAATIALLLVAACSEQKSDTPKEPAPAAQPQTDGQQGMSGMSGEKSAEPPQ